MSDNIKRIFQSDWLFFSLVLTAVAITAFGLGRLSERQTTLKPQNSHQAAVVVHESKYETADQSVVASKKGSKYHLPWCPGAQQMNAQNKITFASSAEAEAAGYTPAANCKGL